MERNMNFPTQRMLGASLLGLGASLALFTGSLTAQDSSSETQNPQASEVQPQEGKPEKPKATTSKPTQKKEAEPFPTMDEVLHQAMGPKVDPQERIRQLFGEVETNLRQVDLLLSGAAAGDTRMLEQVADSGIATLLNNSLKSGREAQKQIQEIIKLAKQAGKKQSSSGSSSPEDSKPGEGESGGSGQGSPLNRGEQQQSAEQTPEMGGQEPSSTEEGEQQGEEPGQKPEGEKPGGDKPGEQPANSDPKDCGESDEQGKNRAGQEEGDGAAGAARRAAQANDGWGDLPTHVKDTFRSQGRSELPVRYRDWIDEYYRKLNRRGDH